MLHENSRIPNIQMLLEIDKFVRAKQESDPSFPVYEVANDFDANYVQVCYENIFNLYHEAAHFVFGFLGEIPGNYTLHSLNMIPSQEGTAQVRIIKHGKREPLRRYVYANLMVLFSGRWCEELIAQEFSFPVPVAEAKSDFQKGYDILAENYPDLYQDKIQLDRMLKRLEWLVKKILKEDKIQSLVNNMVYAGYLNPIVPAEIIKEIAVICQIKQWR
jgi:hypothetical protein